MTSFKESDTLPLIAVDYQYRQMVRILRALINRHGSPIILTSHQVQESDNAGHGIDIETIKHQNGVKMFLYLEEDKDRSEYESRR